MTVFKCSISFWKLPWIAGHWMIVFSVFHKYIWIHLYFLNIPLLFWVVWNLDKAFLHLGYLIDIITINDFYDSSWIIWMFKKKNIRRFSKKVKLCWKGVHFAKWVYWIKPDITVAWISGFMSSARGERKAWMKGGCWMMQVLENGMAMDLQIGMWRKKINIQEWITVVASYTFTGESNCSGIIIIKCVQAFSGSWWPYGKCFSRRTFFLFK